MQNVENKTGEDAQSKGQNVKRLHTARITHVIHKLQIYELATASLSLINKSANDAQANQTLQIISRAANRNNNIIFCYEEGK